ncbi:hypothetical protein C3492_27665 [Streptomyces sp. Ru62]|nr:hypothetical protein C3492_27665 [Streptomyces sp. Ru62]
MRAGVAVGRRMRRLVREQLGARLGRGRSPRTSAGAAKPFPYARVTAWVGALTVSAAAGWRCTGARPVLPVAPVTAISVPPAWASSFRPSEPRRGGGRSAASSAGAGRRRCTA